MMFLTLKYWRLFFAVFVTGCCLIHPFDSRADGPERDRFTGVDSGSTIAFILTVSGRPQGVLSIPVSELRAAVSGHLATTLWNQGFVVVPQGKVLPIMREWRIRDGKSIPRGFLDHLADSLGVQLLLVANLVVQHNELVMTARYLDPETSILVKVNMTERTIVRRRNEDPDASARRWLSAARQASIVVTNARLAKPLPASKLMLTLDAQPVGCSPSIALIASHALLSDQVERGDWVLVDPAVTIATLHDAGHSERSIGADARTLLRSAFGSAGLMIPGFISYAPARKARGQVLDYDETEGVAESVTSDFAMSLRFVDLESGSIVAGKEVFLPIRDNAGWFGIPRNETLLTRLKVAAGYLSSDMNTALEEF